MDININQAEVLPRSGIPIAAGLENVYISLAGLIGAGKTTLATALGEELGLPAASSRAFARAASFAAPAALRSRIIASTSWRRERTIAFFSMSKTVLVEREAACMFVGEFSSRLDAGVTGGVKGGRRTCTL